MDDFIKIKCVYCHSEMMVDLTEMPQPVKYTKHLSKLVH